MLRPTARTGSLPVAAQSNGPTKETLAFLVTIQSYDKVAQREAERAVGLMARQASQCPALPATTNKTLSNRVVDLKNPFTGALTAKLLASRYAELAQKLSGLKPQASALRVIARADATVAIEANKLKRAKVDFCRALTKWKSLGWTKRPREQLAREPFTPPVNVNQKRTRAAKRAALASLPALRRLGSTGIVSPR
jgi:hypothetical protein